MVFSSRYPEIALQLAFSKGLKNRILEDAPFIHLEDVEVLYIYGLCNFTIDRISCRIVFLEDDLEAFKAFSHLPQAKEILEHPLISIKYISGSKNWDIILECCAAEFPFKTIEVVATQTYRKKTLFQKIRLSLFRKTVLWHSAISENISGHLLHRNIISNLRRISQCSFVNRWTQNLKDIPLIICGAGPSLKLIADDLAKSRNHALILGCGSALSALSHLNIRPHLGIAIDPNAREYDCLKGCRYSDLPLLFGSRLYPKVFELFKGPYGYIRSGTGGLFESHVEEVLGLNDPYVGPELGKEALSVTTLALALGRSWGCNPIILAGIDLSYSQQNHYAEGVPVSAKLNSQEKSADMQLLRRKGIQGKTVWTLVKWIMERDTMDRFVKNYPEIGFFNASPQGLGFKNIPQLSLKEISKKPAINLDEKIEKILQDTKIVVKKPIDEVFAGLYSSFEKCRDYFTFLSQENRFSGKAVLYESELESEIAYQLIFNSTQRALEQIGEKKWKHLEEASTFYLETFRNCQED